VVGAGGLLRIFLKKMAGMKSAAVGSPDQGAFGPAVQKEIIVITVFPQMKLKAAELVPGLVENQQRFVPVHLALDKILQKYFQGHRARRCQSKGFPAGQESAPHVEDHDIFPFSPS